MRWLLPILLALGGCADFPLRAPAGTAERTAPEPATTIEHWRLDGRVAMQRGDEGWSATLRWAQDRAAFRLRLVAPLGRGTWELAGDAERCELRVPDGRVFSADEPATLMSQHLGWSIPVRGVRYWIRGVAAPYSEPTYERRDEAGMITDIEQDGWRISVLRRAQVEAFELPTKLYLHRGDLKVRIVVSSWTLNPV